MKVIVVIAIVLLALLNVYQFVQNNLAYRLSGDAIPDERAALEVAVAVINAVRRNAHMTVDVDVTTLEIKHGKAYGKTYDIWWVYTSAPPCSPDDPIHLGGQYEVVIRKSDGKILEIYAGM
jgi:hypothetical protein